MRAINRVLAAAAIFTLPVMSYATPVEYSFDLKATDLRTSITDPYYDQFHLGQIFHGTFTYDPDSAIYAKGFEGDYSNAVEYSVRIGDALIGNAPHSEGASERPYIVLSDGAPGEADGFSWFDEVPWVLEGFFGGEGGYAEEFRFSLIDSTGTALSSTVPGLIDFTGFDSGRFGFWWNGPGLEGAFVMHGDVLNVQRVPEPNAAVLMLAGLLGLFSITEIRRRRNSLHVVRSCELHVMR